jgi:hypothetical protein
MKTSRAEMKKAMEAYINGMTKEELLEDLEDAGLSFYKNFKVSIFSHLPDYEEQEAVAEGTEHLAKKTLFSGVCAFSLDTLSVLNYDIPLKDDSQTSCSLYDETKVILDWLRTEYGYFRMAA